MLRGTQIISGDEANAYVALTTQFRLQARELGWKEVIVPSIWERSTFHAPDETMWLFKDKGNRDVCLIPEVTALLVEALRNKIVTDEAPLFYVSRCYRYDRPQLGRYREFTQFGVEYFGTSTSRERSIADLNYFLTESGLKYRMVDSVQRGLAYYTEPGFEAEADCLGAQKQVAGGGRYADGIGWAIGVERLLLALDIQNAS